jgi:hypothetical protein
MFFLASALFWLAIDIGFLRTAGSPKPVKNLLASSGIYNTIISNVLDQDGQVTAGNLTIPLKDPLVKSSIDSTYNQQFVQSSAEGAIDSIYSWLDGKSASPSFNINLSSQKDALAGKLATAVETRAATLPRCTAPPVNTNPFDATCLPPGVTPAQLADNVRSNIQNSTDFLKDQSITPEKFKKENSNQSVFQNQNLPKGYQHLKSTPILLAILALVWIAAAFFLSASRLAALRNIGLIFLVTGLFLLLLSIGLNKALDDKVIPKIKMSDTALQDASRKLVHNGAHQINSTVIVIGTIYTVIGALATASYFFTSRQHKPATAEPAAPQPAPETKAPAKKAPKKVKVQ